MADQAQKCAEEFAAEFDFKKDSPLVVELTEHIRSHFPSDGVGELVEAANADVMHRFFANIGAVLSGDVPKAIKAANRGRIPLLPDEDLLDRESRARIKRAAINIYYDRRIERRK